VRSVVIPAGVDCEQYYYQTPTFLPAVLFLINFDWIPNSDAFEYYRSEIHPLLLERIPGFKTIIVGRSTEKIPQTKKGEGMIIKGYIDDFNSLVKLAPIAIIPLRIGGGMRVKLVEMMAKGMTIVSTSIGAEGVDVTNGENIVLADEPTQFADAIKRLLESPEECRRIGRNGRKLVELKYSWNNIGDKFFQILQNVIRG
jgi:glycosyltransferase involved in cell wall biosynthesis